MNRTGLQFERTAMAWQRTALGIGGLSLLLLHRGSGDPVASIPGAAGLLAALTLLLMTEARYLRHRRSRDLSAAPMGAAWVRLVAAGIVVLAGASAVMALGIVG